MSHQTADQLLAQETAILEATELVYELLHRTRRSRSELPALAGVTEYRLAAALEGGDQLTVGLLAGVVHALGFRLVIEARS